MRCKDEHTWGKTAGREGRICTVCSVTESELYMEAKTKKESALRDAALKGWDEYQAEEK